MRSAYMKNLYVFLMTFKKAVKFTEEYPETI